jgi:hypothetical protein
MAKRVKHTDSFGKLRRYGGSPINALATRGLSIGPKKRKSPAKLLAEAAAVADPRVKAELLKEAAASTRASRAANTRLVGPKAIERARLALERARWNKGHDK